MDNWDIAFCGDVAAGIPREEELNSSLNRISVGNSEVLKMIGIFW